MQKINQSSQKMGVDICKNSCYDGVADVNSHSMRKDCIKAIYYIIYIIYIQAFLQSAAQN